MWNLFKVKNNKIIATALTYIVISNSYLNARPYSAKWNSFTKNLEKHCCNSLNTFCYLQQRQYNMFFELLQAAIWYQLPRKSKHKQQMLLLLSIRKKARSEESTSNTTKPDLFFDWILRHLSNKFSEKVTSSNSGKKSNVLKFQDQSYIAVLQDTRKIDTLGNKLVLRTINWYFNSKNNMPSSDFYIISEVSLVFVKSLTN